MDATPITHGSISFERAPIREIWSGLFLFLTLAQSVNIGIMGSVGGETNRELEMSQQQKPMSKSAILRGLRVQERENGYFHVEIGAGATYKSYGLSLSKKGAQELRATIRKQPDQFGIK